MIRRNVQIGNVKVWFAIQPLLEHQNDDMNNIVELETYICYFKFSEPNDIVYGELLRDNENRPIVFNSIDEAVEHGTLHVRREWFI